MAGPQGQLRTGRYFAVLLGIIVLLWGLVLLTGDKQPKPKLGLDLQGGTSMTLSATLPGGRAPDRAKLEEARRIIEDRVNATGVAEPEVVIQGDRNIIVNVAGSDPDELKKIGEPAELRFREVVSQTESQPPPAASPTPSASGSPSPSASATASGSPKASGSPTATPKASGSPTATPKASGNPIPSGTATPTPSGTASPSPAPVDKTVEERRAEVAKKLGANGAQMIDIGKQIASGGQDPAELVKNAEAMAFLKPFASLSGEDVAVLPAETQFYVPTIRCDQLNARPAGSTIDKGQTVVACEESSKYLLKPAKVLGTDVESASAQVDQQGGGWKVVLSFKSGGQQKWTALTQETQGKQVAIVLDNTVVSAPTIQSVITGDAEITGGFKRDSAQTLAAQLKFGALPVTFKQETIESVSATLGLQQMEAGLLAGAIGLGLVVLYCLFYYRALGLVVIASLLGSGAIVYATIVLLGRHIGFTLTLAGIAGFIVAVGITADSFVVFFERLKDEVKDGRSVRSAVPRAWVRARRTILSANFVSFLGAVVLYILAIGAVKGFAFTLGLSTLIDVVIVFLFTHPLVALLSRSRAFTSPRVSGLGNLRADTSDAESHRPSRARRAVRTKES